MTACPATVSLPVRAAPVFARTENVMEPFPAPLDGLVSTMNPSSAMANQLHALLVVMVIVKLPPLAPAETAVVDSTYEHRPPPALNDSIAENAVVMVPLVARARQKYTTPCARSRGIGQL